MSIYHSKQLPEAYLRSYINALVDSGSRWYVDFGADPELKYSSRHVELPMSKLVFGFANGWALTGNEKTAYFRPKDIQLVYSALENAGTLPRGFMFWVIGEEGAKDIRFSHDLAAILKQRTLGTNTRTIPGDGDL